MEKVFGACKFSKINYLRSIRKSPPLSSIMNLNKILETNAQKCESFNQLFCSVFTITLNQPQIESTTVENKKNNWFKINRKEVQQIMDTLDISKATGPDGLGNQ